jgi:hypothetical protein
MLLLHMHPETNTVCANLYLDRDRVLVMLLLLHVCWLLLQLCCILLHVLLLLLLQILLVVAMLLLLLLLWQCTRLVPAPTLRQLSDSHSSHCQRLCVCQFAFAAIAHSAMLLLQQLPLAPLHEAAVITPTSLCCCVSIAVLLLLLTVTPCLPCC